jgi:hypothetical protein
LEFYSDKYQILSNLGWVWFLMELV